jgi:hypothetical protein
VVVVVVVIVGLSLYEDFWKMVFWVVLKLEICYRVMISWRILVPFRGFCLLKIRCIFAWWNIWISMILLLPLRYFFLICKMAWP